MEVWYSEVGQVEFQRLFASAVTPLGHEFHGLWRRVVVVSLTKAGVNDVPSGS